MYHFVGVGGIGMSGLARILLQDKIPVSGSDAACGEVIEALKGLGAAISIGHDAKHVPEGVSLVVSSGIASDNPEVAHAKQYQLPILHRSDLLHLLMKDKKSLLVAGTHGKTTTTSLLTSVFLHANLNPSYAIGGILAETGLNGSKGSGGYFIAEADESDGSFLKYEPQGAILTNIDNDHMDYYKSDDMLDFSFKAFADKVKDKSLFFYCIDNPRVRQGDLEGVSYGFDHDADLKGFNFRQKEKAILFDVEFDGVLYPDVLVSAFGRHNALNSLAVFGLSLRCGIAELLIREALAQFKGVGRRAEMKGEVHHVTVLDDYAHHPTEIQTTLKGLKEAHPYKRLVVLFQPHRYSRTRDCYAEFGECFNDADIVIMTDIYGSGETPIEGVTTDLILEQVKAKSNVPCRYVAKDAFLQEAVKEARPFDLFVTMGAGDVTKMGSQLLDELKKNPPAKLKMGLVFGGQSVEHEISRLSVANIAKELSLEIFALHYFYITQEGEWISGQEAYEIFKGKALSEKSSKARINPECLLKLQELDLVFPVLHGTFGEDGTIQGFFDMLSIPYVGCNHQSSAICMDKAVTKKLMAQENLLISPFVDFPREKWKQDPAQCLKKIQSELSFPMYVKPVHLGSTVGVSKVKTLHELTCAIEFALTCDRHVIVENEVLGREIEFSVFGMGQGETFPPGEILAQGQIYDYETKYGQASCQITAKADLPEEVIQSGMEFAKRAYLACGCDGFARVDCFLDSNGNYYLNEINPIPGFTEKSMYPKVVACNGISVQSHLNTLVSISFNRSRMQKRTNYKKERV